LPPELRGPGRTTGGAGLLGRILAALATCAMVAIGVMFSLVFLGIAVAAGALYLIWFWWRLRRVRRDMRGASPGGVGSDGSDHQSGNVIDGEVLKGEWKEDRKS
jgi:threonine/homoserine/homoserine lactone efflux protein